MPEPKRVRIGALGCAAPPYCIDQAGALEFFQRHYAQDLTPRSLGILAKLCSHPSVRKRHFALDSPEVLVDEDADLRMQRFTDWATDLGEQAAGRALEQVGLAADDVSALVVNSCTGYICPGISSYLMERLGMGRSVRAYDLVGSGCGGAIPNLEVSEALLSNGCGGVVLSVSVEICSATFQMGNDPSLLVSNAIFADGAAAAVLWTRPEGLELLESRSLHAPEFREDIRYVYRDGQLHNQLSVSLPHKSAKVVAALIADLLSSRGLRVRDVKHWATHGGGAKVLDAVRDECGLSEEQCAPAREVLAEHGNLSSVSAWYCLDRILRNGVEPGDLCVMLAFGAGLSAHAFLLRA